MNLQKKLEKDFKSTDLELENKKYLVSCDPVREFGARSEEEAIELFLEDLALCNECLESYIQAKELK